MIHLNTYFRDILIKLEYGFIKGYVNEKFTNVQFQIITYLKVLSFKRSVVFGQKACWTI